MHKSDMQLLTCRPLFCHQRKWLQRFGGNDLKAAVKLIMRKLIDHSLAVNMNYSGSGTKKYGLAQYETVCRVLKGQ